jgi:hypothetical protein
MPVASRCSDFSNSRSFNSSSFPIGYCKCSCHVARRLIRCSVALRSGYACACAAVSQLSACALLPATLGGSQHEHGVCLLCNRLLPTTATAAAPATALLLFLLLLLLLLLRPALVSCCCHTANNTAWGQLLASQLQQKDRHLRSALISSDL